MSTSTFPSMFSSSAPSAPSSHPSSPSISSVQELAQLVCDKLHHTKVSSLLAQAKKNAANANANAAANDGTQQSNATPLLALEPAANIETALQFFAKHRIDCAPIISIQNTNTTVPAPAPASSASTSHLLFTELSTHSIARDRSFACAIEDGQRGQISTSQSEGQMVTMAPEQQAQLEQLQVSSPLLGVLTLFDLLLPVLFHPSVQARAIQQLNLQRQRQESELHTSTSKRDTTRASTSTSTKSFQLRRNELLEFQTPVTHLLGLAQESEVLPIFTTDTNLYEICLFMSHNRHHVIVQEQNHTCRTKDEEENAAIGAVTGTSTNSFHMLSQLDVMKYIDEQLNTIAINSTGTYASCSLEAAGLIHQPVESHIESAPMYILPSSVTFASAAASLGPPSSSQYHSIRRSHQLIAMNATTSALIGFQHLLRWSNGDLSAIAIVDEEEHLVGQLSISDARCLTVDNLADLLLPVTEYLNRHAAFEWAVTPLTATKNETVLAVLHKLVSSNCPRLFVVNSTSTAASSSTCSTSTGSASASASACSIPIAVVTLTDLCGVFTTSTIATAHDSE